MSLADDFDLTLIIGKALIAGEAPKAICDRLMAPTSWFYSRPSMTNKLFVRAKGEDGYEIWVEGEGWAYFPYRANEKMWLQLLAIEQVEKFFAEMHLNIVSEDLRKMLEMQGELTTLKKEVSGNHAKIEAAAESAANLLGGLPG